MEDCLFCKIVKGEVHSSKVYEDEYVLAFKDINPVAPVHVLVIPKIHIKSYNEVNEENIEYVAKIQLAIKEVAKICGVSEEGYRVICNTGENGGQVVHHLHFHLIGGKKIGPKIVCE